MFFAILFRKTFHQFLQHSGLLLKFSCHSIFNFFNHKNLECKNAFIFWHSCIVTNFKFGSLSFFCIKVKICAWLYINRLYFDCTVILIVVFINYIIYFINIHIFWYWSFVLKGSKRSFSSNRCRFVVCWIHFYMIILKPWFHWSIVKLTFFIYQYFVWFAISLV